MIPGILVVSRCGGDDWHDTPEKRRRILGWIDESLESWLRREETGEEQPLKMFPIIAEVKNLFLMEKQFECPGAALLIEALFDTGLRAGEFQINETYNAVDFSRWYVVIYNQSDGLHAKLVYDNVWFDGPGTEPYVWRQKVIPAYKRRDGWQISLKDCGERVQTLDMSIDGLGDDLCVSGNEAIPLSEIVNGKIVRMASLLPVASGKVASKRIASWLQLAQQLDEMREEKFMPLFEQIALDGFLAAQEIL